MKDLVHPHEPEVPSGDAWKLFRIISEFVDGFETLSGIMPCVSIFGASRLPTTSPYYEMAMEVTRKIAAKGFSIVTGAGPGVMEAANKAAQEAHVASCGLSMDLPYELEPNPFVDPQLRIKFRYFFVRKVMFVRYAQGFVFLPGGFGTMDEFFEVLTLVQTKKTSPVPVCLMGSEYWKGMLQWLKDVVVAHGCIASHDLDLFTISDNCDEVAARMEEAYKDRQKIQESSILK